jgi:hypothetical protein
VQGDAFQDHAGRANVTVQLLAKVRGIATWSLRFITVKFTVGANHRKPFSKLRAGEMTPSSVSPAATPRSFVFITKPQYTEIGIC